MASHPCAGRSGSPDPWVCFGGDGGDSVQFCGDFGVDLAGRHEAGQSRVVGFAEQVWQREFLEEELEEGVQKVVAGFYVSGPWAWAAQGLEGGGDLLNAVAHELLAATGFSAAEQIVELVVSRVGEKDGFLAEVVLDFALLPHGFGEGSAGGQGLVNLVEQGKPNEVGFGILKAEEVFTGAGWQVGGEVVHEGPLQVGGGRVFERIGERLEDGKVG